MGKCDDRSRIILTCLASIMLPLLALSHAEPARVTAPHDAESGRLAVWPT
jgi:hypothetical protein